MANGLVGNSWNGVTHSDTSTPASIALAMLPGIARTRRASAGTRPVSASSPPHTMNAPTAAAKPWDGVGAEASRAAPGVDQATVTGARLHQDKAIQARPTVTDRAISPDAAWVGVAPILASPASTTANDDAKPTTAVTTPARIGVHALLRPDSFMSGDSKGATPGRSAVSAAQERPAPRPRAAATPGGAQRRSERAPGQSPTVSIPRETISGSGGVTTESSRPS